jgi:hypothetical protein
MSIGRWRRVVSVIETYGRFAPRTARWLDLEGRSKIVIPIPPQRERDPTSAVVAHKVDCGTSSEKVRSFAVFAAQDDKFFGAGAV